jgi:TonB family protein
LNRCTSLTVLILLCVRMVSSAAGSDAPRNGQEQTGNSAELAEANRLSQQVVILYNQDKFDEALPLARRALEIREKALGRDHLLVGLALRNLASLYFGKKQYGEAARLYQRSMTLHEKALGANDPKVADVLDELGWSSYGSGDRGKAERCFDRALAIRETTFGADSKEIGETLYAIGQFHQKTGNASKAVGFYRRALPIMEKTLGANHKEVGALLEKCACALLATGNKQESAGMQLRAGMILHKRDPGRVVGEVLQGKATFRAEPVYPAAAKYGRISGTVIVEVTVDETGHVTDARAVCGPDLLVGTSVEAAKRWRFTPTLLSGLPVKVIGIITFNFHL